MALQVVELEESHWQRVREIYQEGIDQGDATFEAEAPDWQVWDEQHLKCCRIAALEKNLVIGWAALSPISERCVYSGVAEVSVYVSNQHQGKGVGKTLLTALIERSEGAGIWTLQAGIFPENLASLAIHRRCGFRVVGSRERIGQMHGIWRDVLLLERRSPTIL